MTTDPPADRLSRIDTMWTVLRRAHAASGDTAEAKRVLLETYGGAVRRYLLALLKDPHAADDLTQEFAVRLLAGGFHAADPARGRFRNYVKTALFHLVSAHFRKGRKDPRPVAPDDGVLGGLAAPDPGPPGADAAFVDSWRAELLSRTWAALAHAHPTQHRILRFRSENPTLSSDAMAAQLGAELGQPLAAANVRQQLKRGRALFASLLLEQVAHTLDNPTPEAVDEELADLNLLAFVKPPEA